MRSYGQYCALAKALDVVGDRWTLLIVRELMLGGSLRYTDLRNALPGIATNLLAERLRELEAADVIARQQAPPPVAATVFSLTSRGERLRSVLDELGRWGLPYMVEGPAEGDVFHGQWLAWPAEMFLEDRRPGEPPISLEVRAEGRPMLLETREGGVRSRPAQPGEHADATVEGSPHAILGLLTGGLDLDGARARGVLYDGDPAVLERLRPAGQAGAVPSL
jgi:DNA-binding HxlR family transcriptional regulator